MSAEDFEDSALEDYALDDSFKIDADESVKNLDAEKATLACIMSDPTAWDRLTGIVTNSDFYSPQHRHVFTVMDALANEGKPTLLSWVTDALADSDTLSKAGGLRYIGEIRDTLHDEQYVEQYAQTVRAASIRRALVGEAQYIRDLARRPGTRSLQDLLSECEARILNVSGEQETQEHQHRIQDALAETIDHIKYMADNTDSIPGLESGFTELDEITLGFQRSDFVVVAGRPSMGKTSLALNIAEHVIMNEPRQPVLFFSVETDHAQLVQRLLASNANIPYSRLMTGDVSASQLAQLESSTILLKASPLYIVDKAGLTIDEMRAYTRRVDREVRALDPAYKENGLGLVVVDYIQLMRAPHRSESRTRELGEISRSLKGLAKDLRVPVLGLSQLNRAVESRDNKRPRMFDLRDSGEIEQDADLVIFIYRDEVYNEESTDKGKAEIIVAKHRNGARGSLKLNFFERIMKFEDSDITRADDSVPYEHADEYRAGSSTPVDPDDSPPF